MTVKRLPKQIETLAHRGQGITQAPMGRENAAWLARIRAEAESPDALLVVVPGNAGSMAIFAEDVVGKSDEELLAYIAARRDE